MMLKIREPKVTVEWDPVDNGWHVLEEGEFESQWETRAEAEAEALRLREAICERTGRADLGALKAAAEALGVRRV